MAQRSADEHRSAVDLGRGQRRPSAITGRRSGAAGRWWLLNGRWRLVIEISGLAISETCPPGEGDHFRVNEDGAVQGLVRSDLACRLSLDNVPGGVNGW